MLIWYYNYLLLKIVTFQKKIGKSISKIELDYFIRNHNKFSFIDPTFLIKLGEKLDLFKIIENSKIVITEMGKEFLKFRNKNNPNMLSIEQKQLLENYFFNSDIICELANLLRIKKSKIIIIKNFTNPTQLFLITLLRNIGLTEDRDDSDHIIISEKLFQTITEKIPVIKSLIEEDLLESKEDLIYSEEDLLKKLEEQRAVGKLGEDIVLEFEIERVRKFASDLIEKIEQISRNYVECGYDIISFNEDRSKRYIEVKASNTNQKRFFISRNEFQVSKKYKENYWLYFVDLFCDEKKIYAFPYFFNFLEEKIFELIPTHFEIKWNIPDEKMKINSFEIKNRKNEVLKIKLHLINKTLSNSNSIVK